MFIISSLFLYYKYRFAVVLVLVIVDTVLNKAGLEILFLLSFSPPSMSFILVSSANIC